MWMMHLHVNQKSDYDFMVNNQHHSIVAKSTYHNQPDNSTSSYKCTLSTLKVVYTIKLSHDTNDVVF